MPLTFIIDTAFRKRQWPSGFQAPANWPRNRSWKSLTEFSWQGHDSLPETMNAEAWCYFLPSIMALSIRIAPRRLDVASRLIEGLKADTSASQAFLIERYRLLSPEERATISEWLNRISRHEIYPGEQIVEAFQTLLWLNGLATKWPVPKS